MHDRSLLTPDARVWRSQSSFDKCVADGLGDQHLHSTSSGASDISDVAATAGGSYGSALVETAFRGRPGTRHDAVGLFKRDTINAQPNRGFSLDVTEHCGEQRWFILVRPADRSKSHTHPDRDEPGANVVSTNEPSSSASCR